MAQKNEEPGTQKSISRRKFLKFGIGGVAAVIAGSLLYPLARFAASPAFASSGNGVWNTVGKVGDFTANQPKKVDFSYRKQDGWMAVEQKSSCWVIAKGGDAFDVFNPKCTHLGCAYHWDQNQNRFLCPCHGGVYDISGKVLAGPPPRPLDRLDYKVESGKLLIKGV